MKTSNEELMQYLREEYAEEVLIDYYKIPTEFDHVFVVRSLPEGGKETIEHIHTEYYMDEVRFVSTDNIDDKELFPTTTDLDEVEMQFKSYARQLRAGERERELEALRNENGRENENMNKER